jgi:Immunity protein 42
MIFGDPKNIAIAYEVLDRQKNSNFCFGIFNIFIDDVSLVGSGSNWTINSLISCIKQTSEPMIITDIETHGKEQLYRKACESRGYWMFDTPKFNESWWSSDDTEIAEFMDKYSELLDKRRTKPPFGTELVHYSEIVDEGWRMFIFATNTDERIVYSNDLGKTVFEKHLPKNTIKDLIRALPIEP